MTGGHTVIKVENLTYSYGPLKALRSVSFEVREGEVVSVIGPNGSGKTTLLKCIMRILKPSGAVYLDGKEISKLRLRDVAKLAGYVPQEHHPVFTYRVIDFVLLGRAPHHSMFSAPSRKEVELCMKVLKSLGIEHLAERPYTSLSGGQAQLVLIAKALAQGAKVLLLDEPTAHLDYSNQFKVLKVIKELTHSGRVKASIMTLHDPNQAMLFSDKAVLLKDGEVVAVGKPEDVLTPERLRNVYGIEFTALRHKGISIIIPHL